MDSGYPALPLVSWGTLLVACLWSLRAAWGVTVDDEPRIDTSIATHCDSATYNARANLKL